MIAGEFGGRQLLAPKGWQVRPTPERAREALFSALGDIAGFTVADLYCGTGALGIEAISRGAARAVFVDQDIRPVMGNVHNLGLTERSQIVRQDSAAWVTGGADGQIFDLILLDPPYRQSGVVAAALDPVIASILAPGGKVVVESEAGRPLELPSLEVVRERRYGRSLVTFHIHPSSQESR
ncbi:MAG: RsmD family RNA methyltransferase [Solirubrobacterales bacterium]